MVVSTGTNDYCQDHAQDYFDRTVLATAPQENARNFFDLASNLGITVRRIGTVDAGEPGAWPRGATQDLKAPPSDSERFSADSWFSAGIERYIQLLNDVPLPEI
ncbi:MAG TPA: hypothetical protein VHZ78_06965 [Rhizomicrobium sp.]|jgi:hypothetical protein|nr:hypothetical protein [Rhizomicrobium sp.]